MNHCRQHRPLTHCCRDFGLTCKYLGIVGYFFMGRQGGIGVGPREASSALRLSHPPNPSHPRRRGARRVAAAPGARRRPGGPPLVPLPRPPAGGRWVPRRGGTVCFPKGLRMVAEPSSLSPPLSAAPSPATTCTVLWALRRWLRRRWEMQREGRLSFFCGYFRGNMKQIQNSHVAKKRREAKISAQPRRRGGVMMHRRGKEVEVEPWEGPRCRGPAVARCTRPWPGRGSSRPPATAPTSSSLWTSCPRGGPLHAPCWSRAGLIGHCDVRTPTLPFQFPLPGMQNDPPPTGKQKRSGKLNHFGTTADEIQRNGP